MTIRLAASGFALTLTASALVSAQGHFPSDEAIREIARQAGTISGKVGIVIGVLDADGSRRVVSVGDVPYDGRTLFEIGSISKVFTGILLAEMAERGEVRLEQPVAELLPGDVVVPSRNGRQIRLVDYLTFVGLDPERRLGVVVLSNQIPVLVSGQTPLVTRIGLHLLDARMPVSFAALERPFSLLPVVLALLLVTGVFVAWRQTGASIRRSTLAAAAVTLGLVVWMAATYAAAAFGLLRFAPAPPTMMVVFALMLVLSVGLGISPVGLRLAAGLPLSVLVGVQGFRLPLELLMHRAYDYGLMPRQMSYSGLNFDILTGVTALVVGPLLATGHAGIRTARSWNLLGTLLLVNIVTIAMLSAPTPLRVFREGPANVWITAAPYVWLPAVMVAFAILGHIVIYRRLRLAAASPEGVGRRVSG